MGKKIIGIMVVGLVIALLLPIGSATLQKTDKPATKIDVVKPASQLEITLKGGLGVHAVVKNIGTTDVNDAEIEIMLDGPRVIWGSQKTTPGVFDIKAGETKHLISPVLGFGSTNIEFTVGTTTQTASAKVLFWFVYRVE